MLRIISYNAAVLVRSVPVMLPWQLDINLLSLNISELRMIEVTCNDRLGKKVRVKCKYPLYTEKKLKGCMCDWLTYMAHYLGILPCVFKITSRFVKTDENPVENEKLPYVYGKVVFLRVEQSKKKIPKSRRHLVLNLV